MQNNRKRECMLNATTETSSNSAEKGKKKKKFKRHISSSKGNTKGLYKFIFHITLD